MNLLITNKIIAERSAGGIIFNIIAIAFLCLLGGACFAQTIEWSEPQTIYWPTDSSITPNAKLYTASLRENILIETFIRNDTFRVAVVVLETGELINTYEDPRLLINGIWEFVPVRSDSIIAFFLGFGVQAAYVLRDGIVALYDTISTYPFYALYPLVFSYDGRIIGLYAEAIESPCINRFEFYPDGHIIAHRDGVAIPNNVYPLFRGIGDTIFILSTEYIDTFGWALSIYKTSPFPDYTSYGEWVVDLPRFVSWYGGIVYMFNHTFPVIGCYDYYDHPSLNGYTMVIYSTDSGWKSVLLDHFPEAIYWTFASFGDENPYIIWPDYYAGLRYGQIIDTTIVLYGLIDPISSGREAVVSHLETRDTIYILTKTTSGTKLYKGIIPVYIRETERPTRTSRCFIITGLKNCLLNIVDFNVCKSLTIYDITGKYVYKENFSPNIIGWPSEITPNGLYFAIIKTEAEIIPIKLLLIK